jgi:hypothetical protein
MPIDPVIPLLEEIRIAEEELQRQRARNAASYSPKRDELIALMLGRIASLYDDLYKAVPTSPIGAGALLSLVWRWLPPLYARYDQHLARIGSRMQAGQRSIEDLTWLRALAAALDADVGQSKNLRIVLNAAILGASRPILIFRRAILDDPKSKGPGLEELSRGRHFWPTSFPKPSQS